MKNVIPEVDSKSMDIVADNISKLKELFPEAFTEGKVDFDALKEVLGDYIDGREERYSFTWSGKSKARMLAQTPSTGTLRPCKEESVDWDNTQNLFIEGDNLEVLKLLQKSYHKKVKMIYIDPPYNTGKDFVYKDNFKDNIKNYKEITGQVDGEGRNLSSNPETSGRYHTDWLNMMYPRLKLARNLLKDDGVIFISIGDDEFHNVKNMCDEIFGEDNFILTFSRMMKSGGAKGRFYTPSIDYILAYAKSIDSAQYFRKPLTKEQIDRFYNKTEMEGPRKGELYGEERLYKASLDHRPNQRYYIKCPDGSFVIPPGVNFPKNVKDGEKCLPTSEDGVWKWIYTRYSEELEKGNIVFKKTSTSALVDENGNQSCWNIYNKLWLQEQQEKGAVPSNFIGEFENRQSSAELKEMGIPFDFAKPTSLIKYLIGMVGGSSGLILDFFSGSATTAHSVMKHNAENNETSKYIMVQLPEMTDEESEAFKAGYKTISDISKERIRRAAAKIKEENPDYQGDLGFKVFKLDSTNIKPWELDFDLTEQDLEDQITNIKHGRKEEDVLYEVLLKYGLDLTLSITEHSVAGHKVFDIGMGALMICLSDDITLDVVEGIAKLKDKLTPEIMRVVFKDAGFADDVVKTNAVQILKQAGIEDVRSL